MGLDVAHIVQMCGDMPQGSKLHGEREIFMLSIVPQWSVCFIEAENDEGATVEAGPV